MDANENTTTETVVAPERSLGNEIARSMIVTAATTAGMMVVTYAIGFTAKKLQERKVRKALADETTEATK